MRTVAIMSIAAAVLLSSGCGDGRSPESTDPTVTVPSTQSEPTGSTPTPSDPAPATAPPAAQEPAQQWAMPNLVGATLQDAQDQIQALTGSAVFFTGSHDLSGENRNQVLDANWKVCSQNVGPGAALTTETKLDFGVVKLEESCP